MKKLLLIPPIILVSFICRSQDFPPAPEGKSVVYFFRISGLGSAINFTYLDSIRIIGKFSGQNYIRYECNPGHHLLWARSENRDFIEADFEAGRIYVIEATPQMGAFKAGVHIQSIDLTNPKKVEQIKKLMAKKQPKSLTEAELAEMTKEFAEPIQRGMEKYKEDKAMGKAFKQLARTMYYRQP